MQVFVSYILLSKADINITISMEMNSRKSYTDQGKQITDVNSPITR